MNAVKDVDTGSDGLSNSCSFVSEAKSSTSPSTSSPNPFDSVSLETLGLTPSPAEGLPLLPSDLSPAVIKRIAANADNASLTLEWSDKTTVIASLRASEIWRVERLINEIPCFGAGELPDVAAVDIQLAMSNLRISDAMVDEVASMVQLLAEMHTTHQDIVLGSDGEKKVGPKFLSYVAATAETSGKTYADAAEKAGAVAEAESSVIAPGDVIRAVQKLANAVVRNPRGENLPRMAALVGLCVSRAWCAESEAVLHLTWIRMVRALGGVGAASAHACVAAFSPSNGVSRIGKFTALALTVLSRIEGSIFASFATLHIGTRPGFEALRTPSAALEFLSAVLTVDEPICTVVVDEIAREFLG